MRIPLIVVLLPSAAACLQPFTFAADFDSTAKLSPGDHCASINGVRQHYHVAGHGPLVLVVAPGWGIGAIYLQNSLAPLEENFIVLFIDPRGRGKSARPSDDR